MAKLSARGRVKVFQVSKEWNLPDTESCSWRRKTVALMSDNTVLEKDDVIFRASGYMREHKHTWGWKVKGKLNANKTKEQWLEAYVKAGFTESK